MYLCSVADIGVFIRFLFPVRCVGLVHWCTNIVCIVMGSSFQLPICFSLELVVEPWIDGLWDAMRRLISVSAAPKEETRKSMSSEVDDSALGLLEPAVLKERNVDAKVATTKSKDTSLPPLPATTSSPQIGRRKNASEDIVPTKLASLPASKSVTSSNTSSSSSSPFMGRANTVAAVTAVPTKPSPLSSPRLKHLESELRSARVSAPSLGSTSTMLTPNQLWTGYRKGALKPIEGKSGDMADIDDHRQDDNFLFGIPSKTFLTPLEGRGRSISLTTTDCVGSSRGDMDATQSSPSLPQQPPDASETQHVSDGEAPVGNIEDVVKGIGVASIEGDVRTVLDNTGEGEVHTVLESGIPDALDTVNSLLPPEDEGGQSTVLERLRALAFPPEQSLTTPSKQPSFLNLDLQVHSVRGGGGRTYVQGALCVFLRSNLSHLPCVCLLCTCQLVVSPAVPPNPTSRLSCVSCFLWAQYKEFYGTCSTPPSADKCGCSEGYHGDDL